MGEEGRAHAGSGGKHFLRSCLEANRLAALQLQLFLDEKLLKKQLQKGRIETLAVGCIYNIISTLVLSHLVHRNWRPEQNPSKAGFAWNLK